MKLHLEGDWSPPIVFGLAAIIVAIIINQLANPWPLAYLLVLIYAVIAVTATVAALRGREVPDGSTWESTLSVGLDFFGLLGGLGLLLMGSGVVITLLQTPANLGQTLGLLLLGLGFYWAAVKLTLGAWLVVVTPAKTIITFRGKPITFRRKTYQSNVFSKLHFRYYKNNTGGLYAYHPDTIYEVIGEYPGGRVALSRTVIKAGSSLADATRQVHQMVDDLAKLTGLPAPTIPTPLPVKHYADAAT